MSVDTHTVFTPRPMAPGKQNFVDFAAGGVNLNIELPYATVYSWSMLVPPQTNAKKTTKLLYGHDLQFRGVSSGSRIKITAYSLDSNTGVYDSLGTALLLVTDTPSDNKNSVVSIGISNYAGDKNPSKSPQNRQPVLIYSLVKIVDLYSEYVRDVNAVLASDKKHIQGLNRHSLLSWEWPFCMPGWNGVQDMATEIPGWKKAWPWLVWHALAMFGKRSWKHCCTKPSERLDVISQAIASIAYLNGYNTEKRDDTSKPWCALGTGKDCDDFAADASSLINSLVSTKPGFVNNSDSQSKHSYTNSSWEFVKHFFDVPYMVAGYADPFLNGKCIPHMWCEVRFRHTYHGDDGEVLFRKGDRLPIECTASIAYFGTPFGSEFRFGGRHSELKAYVSRETCQSARAAYVFTEDGKMELRPPPPLLPDWSRQLEYAPPNPNQDRLYFSQRDALDNIPYLEDDEHLYGFIASRKLNKETQWDLIDVDRYGDGGKVKGISQQIMPFASGTVIWYLQDVSDRLGIENIPGSF